jgi:hypothetical protein
MDLHFYGEGNGMMAQGHNGTMAQRRKGATA